MWRLQPSCAPPPRSTRAPGASSQPPQPGPAPRVMLQTQRSRILLAGCTTQPSGAAAPKNLALHELSPNVGDGLRVQAAAVLGCEYAGLAATSIPSVNLTP